MSAVGDQRVSQRRGWQGLDNPYAFLLPAVLVFGMFALYPILRSLFLSFFPVGNGLANLFGKVRQELLCYLFHAINALGLLSPTLGYILSTGDNYGLSLGCPEGMSDDLLPAFVG